jgi:hypothetical protein
LVAIILVGSFAVLVAYSASRLRTAPDNWGTPVLSNDHAATSLAADDGTASEVGDR